MGFEDRQYNQYDDASWQMTYGRGGGGGRWSITAYIIATCFAIFFIDAFTPLVLGQDGEPIKGIHQLARLMALDSENLWRVWAFLTYGFAHSAIDSKLSFFHIGGNMLMLFFLGRPVEQRLGRDEYLKFYLVAIVVAGAAFVMIANLAGQRTFVYGASGAVSAVVFLFICMYPRQKLQLIFPPIEIPAWVLGIILLISDFFNALNPDNHIAWQAHLAGAAFGALYFRLGWNFSWLPLERFTGALAGSVSNKPKLRVHDPDRKAEKLKEEADEILAKVGAHGEKSLTRRERKILNKYSKQLRNNRD